MIFKYDGSSVSREEGLKIVQCVGTPGNFAFWKCHFNVDWLIVYAFLYEGRPPKIAPILLMCGPKMSPLSPWSLPPLLLYSYHQYELTSGLVPGDYLQHFLDDVEIEKYFFGAVLIGREWQYLYGGFSGSSAEAMSTLGPVYDTDPVRSATGPMPMLLVCPQAEWTGNWAA